MQSFTCPIRHLQLFYSVCLVSVLVGCDGGGFVGPRDASPDRSQDGQVGRDATPDLGPPPCTPGELICDGNTFAECGADGTTRINAEVCAQVCNPGVGCGVCEIGGRTCEGMTSRICNDTGDASYFGRDCAEFGSTCGADGYCADECGAAEVANSYLGCEYWVPLLPNAGANQERIALQSRQEWRTNFDFRVVAANTGETTATLTLTRGATALSTETIEPGEAKDIAIPWNPVQAGNGSFSDMPVRVVSNRPITMAMFNPFEYNSNRGPSYTNDASLLFPSHTYQRSFIATSYTPLLNTTPAFVSIIATQDTTVNVRPTARVNNGGPLSADILAGETGTFEMMRGEHAVLQGADLSGTRVEASAPVAVFSGTQCSDIPVGSDACDHIESQMPPIETWSSIYVGAAMGEVGARRRNPVRIYSAIDATTVTITPAPASGGTVTLNDGEFHEVILEDGFVIEGDKPILVAQYLPGQEFAGGQRGDPAMMVLPPTAQYRTDYPFVAPTSYNAGTRGQNFVLLTRSPEQAITLDDAPITTTWTAVGEYEWAIVPIEGGAHRLSSEDPFGAVSYGLGSFTSYAYPAGLDLEVEFVPPPVLI